MRFSSSSRPCRNRAVGWRPQARSATGPLGHVPNAMRSSAPPRTLVPGVPTVGQLTKAEKEGFEPSRQGFPHLTP